MNKIHLGAEQSVHNFELYKLDPGIYRAFMNSAKPFLQHIICDICIMLCAPDTRCTYWDLGAHQQMMYTRRLEEGSSMHSIADLHVRLVYVAIKLKASVALAKALS